MKEMIDDINGKVPTFGYPIIHYTPRQDERKVTDRDVWKHAIVSDGSAIKDLS